MLYSSLASDILLPPQSPYILIVPLFRDSPLTMTRITRNRPAVALATSLTMTADNVLEVSQRAEVAKTPDEGATKQANVGTFHFKDI